MVGNRADSSSRVRFTRNTLSLLRFPGYLRMAFDVWNIVNISNILQIFLIFHIFHVFSLLPTSFA